VRPVHVLVPAKAFSRAKARLHPVLAAPERAALARGMLEHVLVAVAGSAGVRAVTVVTDGDEVAAVARAHGAFALVERGTGLSAVVDAGLADLAAPEGDPVLVLMADLPLLVPEDVDALVGALSGDSFVVAPDRHGLGTNALGLGRGARRSASRFGRVDSFDAHLAAARSAGLDPVVVRTRGLGWDVDVPGDLLGPAGARVVRG